MEQKIIIKGISQKNTVAIIVSILSIIVFVDAIVFSIYEYLVLQEISYFYYIFYDNFFEFFLGEFFSFKMYGYYLIFSVITFIGSIALKRLTERSEITITDNTFFGRLPCGENVEISLNQITDIKRTLFNGIAVSTAKDIKKFYCIENCDEVMNALSYLLDNNRANAQNTQGILSESMVGIVGEQLQRLKEFLDSGVITQEEFDIKKKQILGL